MHMCGHMYLEGCVHACQHVHAPSTHHMRMECTWHTHTFMRSHVTVCKKGMKNRVLERNIKASFSVGNFHHCRAKRERKAIVILDIH